MKISVDNIGLTIICGRYLLVIAKHQLTSKLNYLTFLHPYNIQIEMLIFYFYLISLKS